MTRRVEVAVGGVAVRDGHLLLIRRATEPGAGRWSLPGGRIEAGETMTAALVREMAEETGLVVNVGALVGLAESIDERRHMVIIDLEVSVVGDATPRAGDDAAEAAWVALTEIGDLDLVDGLLGFLTEHDVLGR